jgi:hypothetical protein
MTQERQLEGLRRLARQLDGRSSAKCLQCGELGTNLSPRQAGLRAREHVRETGHEAGAIHVQLVTYRPEA